MLGVPGKQIQRQKLACNRFVGNALRSYTWRGVNEVGLGRGRSCSVIQSQQKSQFISWGALGMEWPLKVFFQTEVKNLSLCILASASHWIWGSSSPSHSENINPETLEKNSAENCQPSVYSQELR